METTEIDSRITEIEKKIEEGMTIIEGQLEKLKEMKSKMKAMKDELEAIKEKKEITEELTNSIEVLKEEVEKKNEEIEEDILRKSVERKAEEYFSQLMYLKADFENYKKAMEREKREAIENANEILVTKLLPVIDNLDAAIRADRKREKGEVEKEENSFRKGVEMTLNLLLDILEKEGLEEIKTIGERFDPFRHEACSKVESDEYPEETVVEELRKGYTFKGKVIRPAMVKVTINPRDTAGSAES